MILSVFGVILLIFCALYLCKISNSHIERINEEYREMISFLYTLKHKISTSSQKISNILSNLKEFKTHAQACFVRDAVNTGLYDSFNQNIDKFVIKSEDKKLLLNYFFEAGKGFYKSELENLELCIIELEKSYSKIKDETPAKKKLQSTLIICSVLLCIILIV